MYKRQCNVLFASPTGTATADGTKADPLSLQAAIFKAACFGTVIKMSVGTYTIDSAITNLTSNITLEGGFDPVSYTHLDVYKRQVLR